MKNIILTTLVIVFFTACKNDGSKDHRILPSSSGNINNLSIVIDNDLWEGSVGERIRDIFGAEVYGLPQQEPLFSMRQMPTVVFSDFATKNRIILKIEKGKENNVSFLEDPYAKPQKLVLVKGITISDIIEQIEQNAPKIISEFKNEEIKEKQRRIKKSLLKNNDIEEKLGLTINIPSAYRIAKEDSTFFWLRRDIKAGTLNILLYQIPLTAISNEDDAINDIIKIRDSIGKTYIPGPVDDSYMITEEAYTPFFKTTILDNKPAFETRSTWEVKNAFMAGPFLNYAIKDEINNRFVVIEGFAFAPSVRKRDYMFELEAILKSVKIK